MSAAGAVPSQLGRTAPKSRRRWREKLVPYLFISPFLISFLVLFLGPAIYSLGLSFFRYKGYGSARFVGLSNYESVVTYHVFWTALSNTVLYWLGHVFPLMIFSFLLAVLVRARWVRGKNTWKPVITLRAFSSSGLERASSPCSNF